MPATAHLYPIVPLAWALQASGHEVRVASHPDMAATITAAGLTAVSVGRPADLGALMRDGASDQRLEQITEALEIGSDDLNLRNAIRYYTLAGVSLYFPTDPQRAESDRAVDDLVAFARSWRPDLVLWDPLVLAAPVAARLSGAAHARVLYGLDYVGWAQQRFTERIGRPAQPLTEHPLAELMRPTLRRFGLDFDAELAVGQWTLDLLPERMRLPVDLRYTALRRVPYTGTTTVPQWLYDEPKRPRVCLTLGMSTRKFLSGHGASPIADIFGLVEELDIELVATVNSAQLADVEELPDRVRIVDYLPLDLLLPTCSAVVHHGGGGTFAAAVAHQVPQLIPAPGEGGDRVAFARYVEQRGAGLTVSRTDYSADVFAEQLFRVLHEPSFQDGAAGLHDDMLATPSPRDVVPVLEKLSDRYRR
jgi:glycosyltransferase (activator-dependent family)